MADFDPVPRISTELALPARGVAAVIALLGEGGTVPFIARYRKEATGGLDEVQIRAIEERRAYVLELEDRRRAIVRAIEEQGKLTEELRARLSAAMTKVELEDLYLPYKKKRRTRAQIARERGLEPLAQRILEQPAQGNPMGEARGFVDPALGVDDSEAALAGARDIVAEMMAEHAGVRALVRRECNERGFWVSKLARGKGKEPTKFEQYYDFREKVSTIPSHRFLAIRRGENEGVLKASIELNDDVVLAQIGRLMGIAPRSPFSAQLTQAISDGYTRLLIPSVESELRIDLKLRSDRAAIDVFGENLRNLLLAAPLGGRPVVGIDPGLRTGCKCVAVDATGKYLDATTINLVRGDDARAKRDLLAFLRKHNPEAVAVGNGTGGREAEAFARRLCADEGLVSIVVVSVNEAGASVYSASDVAREEFPDLDLTLRGAISIARRLQDPLAELVKIEPNAIGVGQYQHDVHQPLLARKLSEVVESCVNHVGVGLNTASASLLSYVAGIGHSLARKIIDHRERHGAFPSRRALLKVSGLGPRAFEQAAGFLRIRGGKQALDASAVHPERYELVATMAADLQVQLGDLVGDPALVAKIDIERYISSGVGEPTLRDIVVELKKPGLDPRDTFAPPQFRDDVREIGDLVVGMSLEGVVTNVTAFGAFVDVGVHQDGLVHISKLSDRFIKDPSEVVRVGDKLRVRVLDVDTARRRISLTARKDDAGTAVAAAASGGKQDRKLAKTATPRQNSKGKRASEGFSNNPFARLKS